MPYRIHPKLISNNDAVELLQVYVIYFQLNFKILFIYYLFILSKKIVSIIKKSFNEYCNIIILFKNRNLSKSKRPIVI
jgi:hypothetical protein